MKRRVIVIAILICAAFLIATAIQYTTHAQESTEQEEGAEDTSDRPGRPGMDRGGRPGGRSGRAPNPAQFALRMLPLEAFWSQLSLNMDIDNEALVKARTVYKKAWKDRKGIIKTMADAGGDREAMRGIRSTVEDIQAEIATKLKDVLTPEQMEQFTKYEKKYREEQRSARGGFGGGRPGGGGRGQ